jgi:hypothetical protein
LSQRDNPYFDFAARCRTGPHNGRADLRCSHPGGDHIIDEEHPQVVSFLQSVSPPDPEIQNIGIVGPTSSLAT